MPGHRLARAGAARRGRWSRASGSVAIVMQRIRGWHDEGREYPGVNEDNAHSSRTPRVWLLLGHKAGDNNQVLALAEALAWPWEEKRIVYRPWELLSQPAARRDAARHRSWRLERAGAAVAGPRDQFRAAQRTGGAVDPPTGAGRAARARRQAVGVAGCLRPDRHHAAVQPAASAPTCSRTSCRCIACGASGSRPRRNAGARALRRSRCRASRCCSGATAARTSSRRRRRAGSGGWSTDWRDRSTARSW